MSSSSQQQSSTSQTGSTKIDSTRASQNVWLVKVPKYLAEVWEKADGSAIVGSLRIPINSAPNNVSFHLADNLVNLGSIKDVSLPQLHKFIMSDVRQSMAVFSESAADEEDGSCHVRDKLAFEGKIAKRADCRPVENANYMQMKRKAIEKACRPVRQAKQVTDIVTTFKPVNDHQMNLEPERKRKEDGKRVRADRDEVLEKLYSAFEKHQYYTLKDLVSITQQPVVHLKSILRDVCNYNLKNPHKNTYELKPEYRHYKSTEEGDAT